MSELSHNKVISIDVISGCADIAGKAVYCIGTGTLKAMKALNRQRKKIDAFNSCFFKNCAASTQLKPTNELLKSAFGEIRKEDDLTLSKATILDHLSSFCVQERDLSQVNNQIHQVLRSGTLDDLINSRETLVSTMAESHTSLVRERMVESIEQASKAVGFPSVHIIQQNKGRVVIAAENASGQTMIHNVITGKTEQPRIESEVLGVHDNSCTEILNQFNEELNRQGVNLHRPDNRKSKGSVPVLQESKEYIAQKNKRSRRRARGKIRSNR
ncbi:MAG TPA: hypothetical protein PK014_08400 [Thermoanaerobaculia bacterium]|nr:hypothetical protein [Thermoanaerobaculia bacterium]HUM30151.1 hypothetical protein [Thermoanaerobaculia bacterium]HXK68399.1 hypothetical protein [Thermoanaerobaculia bacterium]